MLFPGDSIEWSRYEHRNRYDDGGGGVKYY